jgi:hypothetical protein
MNKDIINKDINKDTPVSSIKNARIDIFYQFIIERKIKRGIKRGIKTHLFYAK